MKFSVKTLDLLEALNKCRYIISNSPSQIAFTGVFLEVKEDSLYLTSSDGDTMIKVEIKVNDNIDGSILIAAKPIITYLGSVASETIVTVIKKENGDLQINSNNKPYTFRTIPNVHFPKNNLSPSFGRTGDYSNFATGLKIVKDALKKDDPSILLISENGNLKLLATDRERLVKAEFFTGSSESFSAVLPYAALERASKLQLNSIEEDVAGKSVRFSSTGTVLSTRTIAEPFPDTTYILQSIPETFITFEPKVLSTSLARLASVAENEAIVVSIKDQSMLISVDNTEVGAGEEEILINNPSGYQYDFKMNLVFMQNAVRNSSGQNISLFFSSAKSPIYISSVDPIDSIHIIAQTA